MVTRPLITMDSAKKPWCYDDLFPDVRDAWDAHDKTCESLRHIWLGHKGGVTALGDISYCSGCDVTFFWEGLSCVSTEHPDKAEVHLCECCGRSTA